MACVGGSPQGTAIKVRHVFSCERDERKRALLLQEFDMDHMFGDVAVFNEGKGYCFVCKKVHLINLDTCSIDIFLAGPACASISKLNRDRATHASCYDGADSGEDLEEEYAGASGVTYQYGFRKARFMLACIMGACQDILIYI